MREYGQLDTTGDLLDGHLRGFRLVRGEFEEIEASGTRSGREEYPSDVPGLYLRAEPTEGGAGPGRSSGIR